MKTKQLKIVIKLGSALLTDGKGKINCKRITEVCRQVVYLMRLGHHVLIVTSGAIASDEHYDRSKRLRASVGQPKLISIYTRCFKAYKLEVAQQLLTDQELIGGKTHVTKALILEAFRKTDKQLVAGKAFIRSQIFEAFRKNVVCVINANDVIDNRETKALKYCADNDILAGCVCRMIRADLAIYAITEAGVLDNDRHVIHEVRQADLPRVKSFAKGGNKLGHGRRGMSTKIQVLGALAAGGVTSIMAPGKRKNFIIRAYNNEPNFGTKFIAE